MNRRHLATRGHREVVVGLLVVDVPLVVVGAVDPHQDEF